MSMNKVVSFVKTGAENVLARRRASKALQEMLSMSDHALRDVGVTRMDVRQAFGRGAYVEFLSDVAEQNRRLGVAA